MTNIIRKIGLYYLVRLKIVGEIMQKDFEVTNILSDSTRYQIYQHIIWINKPVTTKYIAEVMGIHVNVAREHLTKLENIDLLKVNTEKTGRGGRPSKLYSLSDQAIEISFPFRDYKLLAKLSIEALANLGSEGNLALKKIGMTYGRKIVQQTEKFKDEISIVDKAQLISNLTNDLGLYSTVEFNDKTSSIYLSINNCPFHELTKRHSPMICSTHHAFLEGILFELFDSYQFEELSNMTSGCKSCEYRIQII